MARSKEFRFQPSNPGTPSETGVSRYYAGLSGELKFVTDAGSVYDHSAFYVTTNAASAVTTGTSAFVGGAGIAVTGIAFGTTGSFTRTSFLGAPNAWVSVNISGATYSIPAYTRS